jgi:hypothetical protein
VEAFDVLHLADDAVGQIAMHQVRLGLRTPLRPDLHGDLVLVGRGHHRLAFLDRAAGRLFHVDVLAALGRVDRLHAMPMVGRPDHDGVDILSLQEMPIVAVGRSAGQILQRSGQPVFVHVAHRHALRLAFLAQRPQFVVQTARPTSPADVPYNDAIVRARPARRRQHAGRNHIRRRHQRVGRLQKGTPRHRLQYAS